MKKFLLLFVIVISFSTRHINAQYLPIFGDSITEWNLLNGYCDAICTDSSKTVGDTLINSLTYKIILNNGITGMRISYVREDSTQGKAWQYFKSINQEYLVYDLNLMVGDSFYVYNYLLQPRAYAVDSVYNQNGRKHIRLQVQIIQCGIVDTLYFIEGVGTNAGVAYQGTDWNGYPNDFLLCQFKDTVQTYSNTLFAGQCYICMVSVKEHSEPDVNIFPNPASEEIHIVAGSQYWLTVIDMLGKQVYREWITNEAKLNISSFPPGLYRLYLTSDKKIFQTSFVKN